MPWLALLLLVAVFELPALWLPEPVRPTGEGLLLVAAWLLALRVRPPYRRALRWLLASCVVALLLERIDRVVFLQFMGEEPLLYDQIFMLRHLFVLFSDLWSWAVAGVVLGVLLACALCVLGTRFALRVAEGALLPERSVAARRAAWLLCACAVLGSVLPFPRAPAVRFVSGRLRYEIARSVRIYTAVQRDIGRSPYRGYAKLSLRRRPDVYLLFVESYGRVISEHPYVRRGYEERIRSMQQTLSEAGWHAVSAFSQAPIMGGRSWLAEGSVLMGSRVAYEALFRHLVSQIDRVPNLVSFLAGHGYQTLLLAPADRKRSGVEEVNYYHHQRGIRFDDLHYRGPHVGWGIVPDQYSLCYAEEHVLRRAPHPVFLEMHMVTSHAPWEDVPALVPDYHVLNQLPGDRYDDVDARETMRRLRRYTHWERRFAYIGALRATVARGYQATILYDLGVIERFLLGLPGDALVIVIGDHQPPFLAVETRSFDTPVHVLARDPALLEELAVHGFTDGLWLGPESRTALRHEGLFSLLVRSLVRAGGDAATAPAYLAGGAHVGE
jgi:hypothetical protein